jgi:diguanylate cyclase (GGDEF)-like protein
MRRKLKQLLEDEREEIVNRWAHFMKDMKSSNYELRPLSELKRSCKEFFKGYEDAIVANNYGSLQDQVGKKARLRSTMGFKMSEVQRALFGFKEVIIPFLKDEYKNDLLNFERAMSEIDACVTRSVIDFSEAFQTQLQTKADGYLKEIEQFNQKLEHLSVTDGLTGLYNQRYFREMLKSEIARTRRYSRVLSVVLMDIDGFKRFNDTYGHLQGDSALTSVSRVIRDEIRTVDLAARYGGEEFVLVLPETKSQGAIDAAEKIRNVISRLKIPVGSHGETASFTISAGVSSTEDGIFDDDALIQLADQCLYRAKKTGKNRVCCSQASNKRVRTKSKRPRKRSA